MNLLSETQITEHSPKLLAESVGFSAPHCCHTTGWLDHCMNEKLCVSVGEKKNGVQNTHLNPTAGSKDGSALL